MKWADNNMEINEKLGELKDLIDKNRAMEEKLTDKHVELDTKIGNMARKLENHLYEPDAHHVAMIAKKKKDKKK